MHNVPYKIQTYFFLKVSKWRTPKALGKEIGNLELGGNPEKSWKPPLGKSSQSLTPECVNWWKVSFEKSFQSQCSVFCFVFFLEILYRRHPLTFKDAIEISQLFCIQIASWWKRPPKTGQTTSCLSSSVIPGPVCSVLSVCQAFI